MSTELCPFGLKGWQCEYYLHPVNSPSLCKKDKTDKYEVFDVQGEIKKCPRGYKFNERLSSYRNAPDGKRQKNTSGDA